MAVGQVGFKDQRQVSYVSQRSTPTAHVVNDS
jgi:hypothetical protein